MADRAAGRVALLSIHPRHADAILRGDKKVELRRAPVSRDTERILLYATAPVQTVVGWFAVEGIDEASTTGIWKRHGPVTGITRREHRQYFAGASRAFAIRVGRAVRCDPGIPIERIPGVTRPPQSFQYVETSAVEWIFDGLLAAVS